ncbi:hypothetical protein [Persicirhabdus sediminis]|uniref:Short C-terminal domain-containing protein n=1 Tax=Persicirhabdus sediminis TaxID=454144 RepID=A0A8J7MDW9_9BACT|nr:hypothetical protein [Persicirhabdus sediminis]MBK1790906.1 hypothetical protein [Persicirhabdus sediminis]
MSLVSELEKLEQLHQSGSLSQHEFAIAKRKLLNEDSHEQQVADSQLAKIHNDIEELDRSWLIEREKYMSSGFFGKQRTPSKSNSLIDIIWIIVLGSYFIIGETFRDLDVYSSTLIGLPFIMCLVIAIKDYKKATNYELAEAVYQKKRKELLARKANR